MKNIIAICNLEVIKLDVSSAILVFDKVIIINNCIQLKPIPKPSYEILRELIVNYSDNFTNRFKTTEIPMTLNDWKSL